MHLKNISFAILSLLATTTTSYASFCPEASFNILGQGVLHHVQQLERNANAYFRQAEYDLALTNYQKALHIRRQKQGQDHLDCAITLNNIANVHRAQGKYKHALQAYQKALHIRKQKQGKKHPDYAQILNNMATVYKGTVISKRVFSLANKFFRAIWDRPPYPAPFFGTFFQNRAPCQDKMCVYGVAWA